MQTILKRTAQHENYQDVERLICHLAIRIANNSGISADDLISEGNLCFAKHTYLYDPSKGASYTTYLYHRIQLSMLDYVRRQRRMRRPGPTRSEAVPGELNIWYQLYEVLDGLSEDAQLLLELYRTAPAEFFFGMKPNELKAALQQRGWSTTRVTTVFAQIRFAILG